MRCCIGVTGATGFIGKALCARLISDGHGVKALVRGGSGRGGDLLPGVDIHPGDITDARSLQGFAADTDAIVHCAGSVRGATQVQFDSVNVDGLRNLINELKTTSSPPRLLSLSSLAAQEPRLSFYASSKFRAEYLLKEQDLPIRWTVFRPPVVYGPGDRELLPLLKLMVSGFALIPGAPQARFSMIYIDDLVNAMSAWVNSQQTMAGVYTLEDGTQNGYDWRTIINAVSTLSGRRVRRLPVPAGVLDSIAWINRTAARIFGYAPMLTPEKLRELRHENWVCDSDALRQVLDWRALTSLPEGLQKTLFQPCVVATGPSLTTAQARRIK